VLGKNSAEPLLKWTGGKRWLIPTVRRLVLNSCGTYFEPFVGGAAIFFNLQPTKAVLSDKNEELINCYIQVRDNPDKVVSELSKLRNTEEQYYAVRASRPKSEARRAARLIFLTNLSFNGIYRVNMKSEFNVPYGRRTHLPPYEPEKIYNASDALSTTRLLHADFEKATSTAVSGDLIYFDPPYTVVHGNNGFLRYNEKILHWTDQVRLANLARTLSRRGCRVIVSNADHPSILELYHGFKQLRVERASCMAATRTYRRTITECVFYN
jgi:DNA adenine methylase